MARAADNSLDIVPLGMSRVQAATYIGVGTSKFDEMVGDGRMPQAKRIDSRRVWSRRRLAEMFEALPGDDEDDPWDGE